jgi:hypothetical protein
MTVLILIAVMLVWSAPLWASLLMLSYNERS